MPHLHGKPLPPPFFSLSCSVLTGEQFGSLKIVSSPKSISNRVNRLQFYDFFAFSFETHKIVSQKNSFFDFRNTVRVKNVEDLFILEAITLYGSAGSYPASDPAISSLEDILFVKHALQVAVVMYLLPLGQG